MSTRPLFFPEKIDAFQIGDARRPFSDILSEGNAFYDAVDYVSSTEEDFKSKKALPPIYTWNTESKCKRIARIILRTIFFPIGICHLLHSLAGKIVLIASSPSLLGLPKDIMTRTRTRILLDKGWNFKRITVETDGYKIDAMIVGRPSTLRNKRWVLMSGGNAEFYEARVEAVIQILDAVHGNGLVFNYPGVGASTGLPNKHAMTKAYRAMLAFLEDQDRGLGAEEIIGYGYSMGGAIQAEALKAHTFKNHIKYVFVKNRTFSNLTSVTNRFFGFLVKVLGWNINTIASSKNLPVPEIIMQTAEVEDYMILNNSLEIISDGVISPKASLAKALFDDPSCPKNRKSFIGMPERHDNELIDPSFLAEQIESFLLIEDGRSEPRKVPQEQSYI